MIRLSVVAIVLSLFGLQALAQDGTLKKIKDTGSITIGHRDASLPFSYYDDKQQPIGYAMDLCHRIVDAVKKELKMPKLETKYLSLIHISETTRQAEISYAVFCL